jgi:hypothetical protein
MMDFTVIETPKKPQRSTHLPIGVRLLAEHPNWSWIQLAPSNHTENLWRRIVLRAGRSLDTEDRTAIVETAGHLDCSIGCRSEHIQ